MFIKCIVSEVMLKVIDDAQILRENSKSFAHLINQAILFDDSLNESYAYQHEGEGLSVKLLSLNGYFDTWKTIERDFALSRYQEIISSSDCWEIETEAVGPDQTNPTKSAMRVRDLLENTSNRFRKLNSFQFCLSLFTSIMLDVIDLYYERLKSSIDAFEILTSTIIRNVPGVHKDESKSTIGFGGIEKLVKPYSSANFLILYLRDAADDLFFIELWNGLQNNSIAEDELNKKALKKSRLSPEEQDSLFDEAISAYSQLQKRIESIIIQYISKEIVSSLQQQERMQRSIAGSQMLTDLSSVLQFLKSNLSLHTNRRILQDLNNTLPSMIQWAQYENKLAIGNTIETFL